MKKKVCLHFHRHSFANSLSLSCFCQPLSSLSLSVSLSLSCFCHSLLTFQLSEKFIPCAILSFSMQHFWCDTFFSFAQSNLNFVLQKLCNSEKDTKRMELFCNSSRILNAVHSFLLKRKTLLLDFSPFREM